VNRRIAYILLLTLALSFGGEAQNKPHSPAGPAEQDLPIAIGLLLPDRSCSHIVKAAELAIDRANASGGYMNREFSLVVRTAEGFWGAGSKESVSLVYDDQVCAIIGSLDGRNGHLAEQVATKSHLTYIETYATDPTLSQAFVPWFMRVVPNDDQQSLTILNQIRKNGGGRTGILSLETYDTRYAVRSLTRAMARENGVAPLVIHLDTTGIQQHSVVERIVDSGIEHLVIPFDAVYMEGLISSLRHADPSLHIYGNLHFTMGTEIRGTGWDRYEDLYLITPFMGTGRPGSITDSRSAYLFDAVSMVINAIQHAGTGRQAITDYLSRSEYSEGSTGPVAFDEMGNRSGHPILSHIEKGVPQPLK
jgi:branched-chain amino acid transport system substrate-binding protein